MTNEATTSTDNVDNNAATTTIVVGEHSAYKDVDALVKAKAEANDFILKLKEENKELKKQVEELLNKSKITEELKHIRENTQMDMENTNTPLPEDAIKQIALKALQESTEKEKELSNLASCKEAVSKVSQDVELAIKNKANELGVSEEYLIGIAKTSPKAFKSMFGIKENVSYDSINFLQSTRQIENDSESDEATAFFKNPSAMKNPRTVAEFINKAIKNPSILSKYNHW